MLNKTVLHKGIDLLSRREHSVKELSNKLRIREYQEDEITEVLNFLVQEDYLNELRYTDSVYRTRKNKGYGKLYIENELSQKGIKQSMIAEVSDDLDIDWYQHAESVYQKRYKNIEIVDQKEKAKRIRFMQYRGFSSDEIFTVLDM